MHAAPVAALLLGLTAPARADVPLPSYREEVVVAAWTELDAAITASCTWPRGGPAGVGAPLRCDEDKLRDVIARAGAFADQVVDDARIHFLIGLAHRHLGDLAAAARAQQAAVARDPDRADAWWELGELRELGQDWAGAREAFEHVTRLVPDGPRAWPGWFKLAQADAHLGDADALERHLQQALRFGFTFRSVEGNEAWRGFYAEPGLHAVLDRMLRVYADDETRRSLGAE